VKKVVLSCELWENEFKLCLVKKNIGFLVKNNYKTYRNLFISLETTVKQLSISTYLEKNENRKPKAGLMVLRKLYCTKAVSGIATSSSTRLVDIFLFSNRNIFQKLNQTTSLVNHPLKFDF
jgi:hypothetical protein